jgi:hypothetical protein
LISACLIVLSHKDSAEPMSAMADMAVANQLRLPCLASSLKISASSPVSPSLVELMNDPPDAVGPLPRSLVPEQ